MDEEEQRNNHTPSNETTQQAEKAVARARRRRSADRDRIHRWTVWGVAIALIGGTAIALRYAREYRRPTTTGLSSSAGLTNEIEADQTRVRGYKDSKPAWIVSARKVTSDRDHARVSFSDGVEATLLDVPTGTARAVVTTSGALFVNGSKTLQATGAVTCRILPKGAKGPKPEQAPPPSPQDMQVVAEQLLWNVGAKSVACIGPVHATLPEGSIEGRDLSVDLTTREFTVKNVHARFYVKEGEAPVAPFARLPL